MPPPVPPDDESAEGSEGHAPPPRVVAVVLTWGGEGEAARCLHSLAEVRYPALEVLLVDNASPDGTGDRLHRRFPDVAYLQTGENLGYAGGNNRGIEWALERATDYVLVLNPDTTVARDAVWDLVEAAEGRDRVGAVGPKILYGDRPDRIWWAGGRFSARHGLGVSPREGEVDRPDLDQGVEEVTFVTGCAVLFSAEAIREVGSFAEDFFMYVEDAELSVRLRRAGFRLLHQPRARILHWCEPETEERTPLQIRMRDRNRRRLMRRHFPLLRRVPFLLRFHVTRLVHLARYAVRGDRPRAVAVLRGMTER